jgi:hypothetical protein
MAGHVFNDIEMYEEDYIELNVTVEGKPITFTIARGDVGFAVDVIGAKGEIIEMGCVLDDDLELNDEEDDEE